MTIDEDVQASPGPQRSDSVGVLFASSMALGWRRFLPLDEVDLVLGQIERQARARGIREYDLGLVSYSFDLGYRVMATYSLPLK